MRAVIIFLMIIYILCADTINAQDSATMPIANETHYDFWIGEWEGTWDEDGGNVGKAINIVRKTLDEKVIHENFEIVEGRSAGFKGNSYSIYDRHTLSWKQTWVDNESSYLNFDGRIDKNKRIFQRKFLNKNNKEIHQRMVFYDILPDSFIWDWESSQDKGETWKLIY